MKPFLVLRWCGGVSAVVDTLLDIFMIRCVKQRSVKSQTPFLMKVLSVLIAQLKLFIKLTFPSLLLVAFLVIKFPWHRSV